MTVLSVAQSVAANVKLDPVPTTLFGSDEVESVEMRELANECAQYITDEHSWQALTRLHTITGDGATESWDLPSDYGWMPKDQQVWSSSLETPLTRIESRNRWLGLEVQSFDFVYNAWIIYGGQMHIKPALGSGATAKFYYQTKNRVQDSGGTNKALFTADTDTFRLDERLLTLCMIWRYREDNGLPYVEDMRSYGKAVAHALTRDEGAKKVVIGRRTRPRGVQTAYPDQIEVL